MINQKFNKLTVIKELDVRNGNRYYLCKCDCGNLTEVPGYKVKNGHVKSCGCLKSKKRDIKGMKFSRLTAIEFAYIKNNRTYWLCRCDCGNDCYVTLSSLTSNATRSCGCLDKEVKIDNIHERMGFVDGTSLVSISSNRKINKNNTSGVRGISFDKKRNMWVAQLTYKRKNYTLGRYVNKEDAVKARKDAEDKYFK